MGKSSESYSALFDAEKCLKTPVFGPDFLIFQQVVAARPRTSDTPNIRYGKNSESYNALFDAKNGCIGP